MGYELRAMSFGEILDAGFQLLRREAQLIVGIAAVLYLPVGLLEGGSPPQASVGAGLSTLPLLRLSIIGLFFLIGAPLVTTANTWAVGEVYVGRPTTVGRALRVAWSMLLPLTGTVLLVYLFVLVVCGGGAVAGALLARAGSTVVGFVIILSSIVLAAYLFLSYLLLWPVMVLEHTFGLAALRRSRQLMRGSLLRGFGITFLGTLIVSVLGAILQIALGYIPVLGPLGIGLARAAGVGYTSAVLVLLYFDIRCRKEGFDLEHLAALVAREGAPPLV
jgi:hypothetical protein